MSRRSSSCTPRSSRRVRTISSRAASISARCSGVITAWRRARPAGALAWAAPPAELAQPRARCAPAAAASARSVWRYLASASRRMSSTSSKGRATRRASAARSARRSRPACRARLTTREPLPLKGVATCWPKKSCTRTQKRSSRRSLSLATTMLAGAVAAGAVRGEAVRAGLALRAARAGRPGRRRRAGRGGGRRGRGACPSWAEFGQQAGRVGVLADARRVHQPWIGARWSAAGTNSTVAPSRFRTSPAEATVTCVELGRARPRRGSGCRPGG